MEGKKGEEKKGMLIDDEKLGDVSGGRSQANMPTRCELCNAPLTPLDYEAIEIAHHKYPREMEGMPTFCCNNCFARRLLGIDRR